jgi:chromosomal replication initiator protein
MMHPIQARVERADWWRDHLRGRCRRGVARKSGRRVILIAQVLVAVGEYYGLTPDEITAKGRSIGEVVRARQIAHYLARKMTGRSYPEIGRQIGDADHSTVIHGCRKIEALLTTNPEVRTDVDSIATAVLHGW